MTDILYCDIFGSLGIAVVDNPVIQRQEDLEELSWSFEQMSHKLLRLYGSVTA